MVHALQRAGRRLSPGGMLISLRPHRRWRPTVAITAPGYRLPIARLVNPAFEGNLRSADSALDRVVDEGWFTAAGTRSSRYRIFLQRPSQMRTYLELINPPRPRFPPGGRARLFALWNSAPPGARIEVTEYLVITVLRRR
ncbi:MAG: hypothetical protein E6H93_04705 [Chloroflexi bacterium]|nr:MAG: hypothetical protein E6H93_04705 [Chloroflexota bacterium]